MTPNATLCVGAALLVTRVPALVADAGQVAGAVGADDTLRSAVGRAAPVALEARAGRTAVVLTALGVRATRAWLTRTGSRRRD